MFKCIVCEQKNGYAILSEKLRDSNLHKVVKCNNCGHVQLDPLPMVEEDQEFYDNDLQVSEIHKNLNIMQIREKYQLEVKRQAQIISEHIKRDEMILEIGSGYGFFMEELESRGFNIEGIEISKVRRKISSEFCKGKVEGLNLLDDCIPDEMINRYDVVVMFHVLEHISDLKKMLSQIKKLIRPGGRFILEVPNLNDHMLSVSKEYAEFYWQRAHISYFKIETLSNIVSNSGYEVLNTLGIQRYGIENAMNWVLLGEPQIKNPALEARSELQWLETFYKTKLCQELRCDTIMMFSRRIM